MPDIDLKKKMKTILSEAVESSKVQSDSTDALVVLLRAAAEVAVLALEDDIAHDS